MIDNKYVKQATEELEYLTGDEAERRIAFLREKAIRDETSAINHATKLGKAEGLAEGKAEGLAEGKAEGLAEGKAEGLAEGKKEIAKKMLENGCELTLIIKVTGLTKEEIEKL